VLHKIQGSAFAASVAGFVASHTAVAAAASAVKRQTCGDRVVASAAIMTPLAPLVCRAPSRPPMGF
jgi:hypothetical protein